MRYDERVQDYQPRLLDQELAESLNELAAVAIDGAKGVGKTSTAARLAKTVLHLDLPETAETLKNDPQRIEHEPSPVLIDEWQLLPHIWDYVRRAVDQDARPGRFLLTGSAVPQGVRLHSGAGRIVRMRMRPMSLAERGLDEPSVSLQGLLTGSTYAPGASTKMGFNDYVQEIVRSGFPGIRNLPERARTRQLDGYVTNIVEREFAEQGLMVRRPHLLLAWLRAYAAATASTALYTTILAAATPGHGDKPSKTTTLAYRDILSSLWLLDPIEAWLPGNNEFARLARAPKHYLADPALAARLLRLSEVQLLSGSNLKPIGPQHGSIAGRLFEALIAQSLHVYATTAEAQLWHFRSPNGDREIDFIVEREDRVVAIEVKLAPTVDDHDVRHLNWLQGKLGERLVARIVLTTGQHAYRRLDGVDVVPAVLLGP